MRLGICQLLTLAFFLAATTAPAAETLRIGTYNVQNYNAEFRLIDGAREPVYPKPEKEKTALRTVIQATNVDILMLQEIGGKVYVDELCRDLAQSDCRYPYIATLEAPDGDRQLAILSRIPFKKIHAYPRIPVRYNKTENEVSRGLLGVTIADGTSEITLYTLHLKSRLTSDKTDPESKAQRLAEATALRNKIKASHSEDTNAQILLLGDFNDSPTSGTIHRFTTIGKAKFLTLLSPVDSRGETWTYRNVRDSYYSRSDYIFASPNLAPRIKTVRIVDLPASNNASDHRLVFGDLEKNPR